jgi:hypothetical protein
LDIIFQCKIKPERKDFLNKTLKIAYDFEYLENQSNFINRIKSTKQRFHSEFRFDVIRPDTHRVTWLHLSGGGGDSPFTHSEFDDSISMPPYS